MIGGTPFRRQFQFVFVLLVIGYKFIREGFVCVTLLDHKATGSIEISIGSNVNFIGAEHMEAELLFELLRIINRHHVIAFELEYTVALGHDTKSGRNFSHK